MKLQKMGLADQFYNHPYQLLGTAAKNCRETLQLILYYVLLVEARPGRRFINLSASGQFTDGYSCRGLPECRDEEIGPSL